MDDAGDDLCYAVDVCNRFSLLPVEPTIAEESGIDDFPTNGRPISELTCTDSEDGLERTVISADSGSCSGAQLADEEKNVEILDHVLSFTAGDMITGEHVINQSLHTEVPVFGNNCGADHLAATYV